MVTLEIQGATLTVPTNLMLLDTCVLLAAYNPRDGLHDDASDFLSQDQFFLIPYVVITETWGMLVGREKRPDCGIGMLKELAELPNFDFMPVWPELFRKSRKLCDERKIDLVDAFLMNISSPLASKLKLRSPIPIATYDTRDFTRCYGYVHFRCFDVKERGYL